jgi:hypothetical protein
MGIRGESGQGYGKQSGSGNQATNHGKDSSGKSWFR